MWDLFDSCSMEVFYRAEFHAINTIYKTFKPIFYRRDRIFVCLYGRITSEVYTYNGTHGGTVGLFRISIPQ